MNEMEEEEKVSGLSLVEQAKAWERLFSNRAWLQLMQALQAQADSLQNDILFGPVENQGAAFVQERKKGQLEGRLSVAATAKAMYEGVLSDLHTERNREEE